MEPGPPFRLTLPASIPIVAVPKPMSVTLTLAPADKVKAPPSVASKLITANDPERGAGRAPVTTADAPRVISPVLLIWVKGGRVSVPLSVTPAPSITTAGRFGAPSKPDPG